jgi:hypothetical protein
MTTATPTTTTPAAAEEQDRRKRPIWKPLAAAGIGGAVLIATGFGVFASLQATANNTTAQSVQTGVLSLSLSNNGAGFAQTVGNLAPTDTVHRFVNLTNNGSIDAAGLGFNVQADKPNSPLVVDGATSKALRVSVTQCSTSWVAGGSPTAPAAGEGTCNGEVTQLLAPTVLSAVQTGDTFTKLSDAVRAADSVASLRLTLTLPDQNETTVNGALPANSIQSQSVALTWTFQQGQRAGTTVNS